MRTIKLRAFHTQEKKMYYIVEHTTYADGSSGVTMLVDADGYCFAPNDTDVKLMQFTGLLDKHGKEVYEGDIVCTENEDVSLSEISWEGIVTYRHCMYVIVQPDDSYTPALCNHKIVSLEVIGNIYGQ